MCIFVLVTDSLLDLIWMPVLYSRLVMVCIDTFAEIVIRLVLSVEIVEIVIGLDDLL